MSCLTGTPSECFLFVSNIIAGVNDIKDVVAEWNDYVIQQREVDLQQLITEEKLKPEETRKYLENAFREGDIKTIGTDINELMPPIGRFGGGNVRRKNRRLLRN